MIRKDLVNQLRSSQALIFLGLALLGLSGVVLLAWPEDTIVGVRAALSRDLFLTVMTGIGVLIAILSIINTMLMSVSERIIEFGILKANGWSRQNVLTLITCESAVLGFVGGVTGCLLGWFATQVINHYWPEHIQLFASAELLAFSFAFSVALGIFGGLYPALWAMRLMPMDAIRRG